MHRTKTQTQTGDQWTGKHREPPNYLRTTIHTWDFAENPPVVYSRLLCHQSWHQRVYPKLSKYISILYIYIKKTKKHGINQPIYSPSICVIFLPPLLSLRCLHWALGGADILQVSPLATDGAPEKPWIHWIHGLRLEIVIDRGTPTSSF